MKIISEFSEKITYRHIKIFLIIVFAIIIFKPVGRTIVYVTHLNNEYNANQRQHVLNPKIYSKTSAVRVPWGIKKIEVWLFEKRPLLEYESNLLIFGPYIAVDIWYGGEYVYDNFVEYHFNENGQLYKVITNTGNKYIYMEDRPNLANIYNELKKEKEESGGIGLTDSISFHIGDKGYYNMSIDSYSISHLDDNGEYQTEEVPSWKEFLTVMSEYRNGEISSYNENALNQDTKYTTERYSKAVEFNTNYYIIDSNETVEENVMINTLLLSD